MRKLLLVLVFCVFATLTTSAQTTTVSGTVTDPNGNVYANGTVAAALIYPSGSNPSVNPSSGPFPLTSLGAFSFSIGDNNVITPANTNWVFTFCANSVNLGPGANIVKVCFNTPPLFITGPTQNITGLLGTPAILGPQLTGTGGFAPGGDLTGSSTSQNVVGLHFGSNPIPLSASTPTGCMQVTAGVLGGTGTNCPTVGGVSSVYGRAGAVTAQSGDYTCGQITGCTPGGGGSPAGPAPVYDVQNAAYGAIPYTSSIAGESTTATCTGGNSHCTLGAALHFTNGEGVVITTGGAVTAQTIPAAPTVTNPSVTGSSTFHYKCLPLGALGDFPGATASTAITNAPSIFGTPQVVISSISLTTNLVTVNATGINAVSGEYESVSGVTGAGATWNGFWKVVTGGANSFTYNLTSANGTGTVSGQSFAQRTNTRGITAYTRTTDGIIHITTDGNHNFTASGTNQPTLAILNGTSPLDFNGIYAVLTASGNTMTLQSAISPSSTETGSVTAGFTTVTVYEEIIVSCPIISAPTVNYAVYGDSPNGGTSITYLGETMYGQSTFVDWGPFLAGSPQRRSYVPTTPPASAQAALFRGVIQAGGGTTSITLTTNITTTPIAGALILHDETAEIAAAMSAAAAGGGTVYLSPSSAAGSTCQYAINYPLSIPQFVGLYLGCGVLGNEPVTRSGYNHIFYDGTLSASNVSTPQFGSATYVQWTGVAKEFLTGNASFDQASRVSGINFTSTVNGQNFLVFQGQGGYDEAGWLYFNAGTSTGGTDVGITYIGGVTGISGHHLHDLAGQLYGPLFQGGTAGSQTGLMPFTPPQVPAIWLRGSDQGGSQFVGGSQLTIDGKNYLNGRGVLYDETFCSNCTGTKLLMENNWNQGPTQPQLSFYGNDGGTTYGDITLRRIQMDSSQIACFGDWARLLGPTVIDNCQTSGGPHIGVVTGNVTPGLTINGLADINDAGQNTNIFISPSGSNSVNYIINTPAFKLDGSGNVTANSYNFNVSAPIIWKAPEGSCTGAQTGQDVLCIGDSTTHQILESDNNGVFNPHLKGSGTFTPGHLIQTLSTNPLLTQDAGPMGAGTGSAGVFNISTSCGGAANCLQWVDDDSTDNCGTATTNFLALINAYAGKGVPQVFIGGSGSGKAYKLSTCNLAFTNVQGVNLHLWGTIDCAMALQSCIQLGATATSGGAVSYAQVLQSYRVSGGGGLIGGTSLTGSGGNGSGTAAGIYVMPQTSGVYIRDIFFGGSGTNEGFGSTVAMGAACTNWSVYFDFPLPDGWVDSIVDFVNSTSTTSGGCGLGNPNGQSLGSNTVYFRNNLVTTDGEAGGVGKCGNIGISDGGTLGGIDGSNNYGFGIPVQLQGIGHRVQFNQLDSTQCTAGGVSAVIQVAGTGTVGPVTIANNVAQLGTGHASNFIAVQNGATPTLSGWVVSGNQNNTTNAGNLVAAATNCTGYGPPANVAIPCVERDNIGMVSLTSCTSTSTGWQQNNVLGECFPQQAANVGATTLYTSVGTPPVLVSCQVILTTAATTSSTLPFCLVSWTDAFSGVAQTATITPAWASGTLGCSGTVTNTVGNSCQGAILITPTNNTVVQFSSTSYASVGGTAMRYNLNIVAARQ